MAIRLEEDDLKCFDLAFIPRVRLFEWNESVHPFDLAEDFFVLSIHRRFFLRSLFKSSDVDDVHRGSLFDLLREYNFVDVDVNDDDIFSLPEFNEPDQYLTDVINFNRKALLPEDYTTVIVNSVDPRLFKFNFACGMIGQLNHMFPRWIPAIDSVPSNSRIVFHIEIECLRSIDLGAEDHQLDVDFNPIDYFLDFLPSNPLHKIHYCTYDPLLTKVTTDVSDQFDLLVTSPNRVLDRVILPANDSVNFGYLVGFLRARIYFLGEDDDFEAIWLMLRTRALQLPESAYPHAILKSSEFDIELPAGFTSDDDITSDEFFNDPESFAYFIEIPQPWALPNLEKKFCTICQEGFTDVELSPPGFTCCDHVLHIKCLFNLMKKCCPWNSPCPNCRHPWLHINCV